MNTGGSGVRLKDGFDISYIYILVGRSLSFSVYCIVHRSSTDDFVHIFSGVVGHRFRNTLSVKSSSFLHHIKKIVIYLFIVVVHLFNGNKQGAKCFEPLQKLSCKTVLGRYF